MGYNQLLQLLLQQQKQWFYHVRVLLVRAVELRTSALGEMAPSCRICQAVEIGKNDCISIYYHKLVPKILPFSVCHCLISLGLDMNPSRLHEPAVITSRHLPPRTKLVQLHQQQQ